MTERLPRKFSGVFATAVAAAGAAVLGLALALPPFGGDEWVETIRAAAAFVGGALLVAGAAVGYLSLSRQPLLPNERIERSADPSAGSWLVVPALVLAASTSWMFSRLSASISLWRDIIAGLDRLNVWQGMWDAPQFSGYYLAPIGLIVAAPALQALTVAAFAAAAIVALVMMLLRSSRLPRVFLIAVLWLAALVFIGGVATMFAARAIPVVEQEIRRLPDPDGEGARWLPQIRRYGDATQSASRTLTLTWAAWALLLPVLAWSDRAARTFATVRPAPIKPIDHQIATDTDRERYFEDIARRIDSR
jgi:hypothetical protein